MSFVFRRTWCKLSLLHTQNLEVCCNLRIVVEQDWLDHGCCCEFITGATIWASVVGVQPTGSILIACAQTTHAPSVVRSSSNKGHSQETGSRGIGILNTASEAVMHVMIMMLNIHTSILVYKRELSSANESFSPQTSSFAPSSERHTGPPGISITGLGWHTTLGITPGGRNNKRAAEQGHSLRLSRRGHHARIRGQLQAPWQTENQSFSASIGTAFWIVGGTRHSEYLLRRPELLS